MSWRSLVGSELVLVDVDLIGNDRGGLLVMLAIDEDVLDGLVDVDEGDEDNRDEESGQEKVNAISHRSIRLIQCRRHKRTDPRAPWRERR